MTITRVRAASPLRTLSSGSSSTYALGASAAVGDLLTYTGGNYPSGLASITDDKGNTWAKAISTGDGGDNFIDLWWTQVTTAGNPTLTLTPASSTDNYLSGILEQWNSTGGAGTWSVDQVNSAVGGNLSTPGATSQAEELALYGVVVDTGTTNAGLVAPTGYTKSDGENDSTNYTGYLAAYRFLSSVGIETATGANPLGTQVDSVIATFKFVAGGPTPVGASGVERAGVRESGGATKGGKTSGVNRAGVREAASAKKAGKAAGVDRFGLRETARAAKQATTLGASRAGMRDAATGAKRATTSATERLGFRETGVGSLPANRVQVERFGMREAGRGTKQAPGAAQERAGVRDAAQASKAAAARATERAGVRDQAAGRKAVTTSAAERVGVRETGVGSVFTGIVTFATERVGFREAVQTTATDAPQRQGAGGAGKTLMQHAMEQAHERRRRQRQKDEDQERGEREEQQREEVAAAARQDAVRNVLRRPADVLAELSGVIDLEAPELAPDAVEDMLAAQALMAEQDARLAAEAERLALLEDDALALLVIEAALAV